jgi:hypothetical protein
VLLVIQQGDPVHEHGAGVGQMMARLVENCETVRVDVTPVHDIEVSQPPSIKPSLSLPATPDDCRNPLAACRASP